MRITILVLTGLAVSLLTPNAYALHLVKRNGSPAVVPLTIHRKNLTEPFQRSRMDRLRRRQTVSEVLENFEQGYLYLAKCTVGTPPQDFLLNLDTGSSDMWLNAPTAQLCEQGNDNVSPGNGEIPCSDAGTYNANASSTYRYIDSSFSIRYVDGTGTSGDYAKDTMEFGGKIIDPIQFGIAYLSNISEGILGIGYPSNEIQVENNNQSPYPNLPQAMTNQGLIQSPAYSLWLDDLDSSTGSILFGGVDTDKYFGELAASPIIQVDGGYYDMLIALSSVTVVSNTTDTRRTVLNQSTPVTLDSGATLSYLPANLSEEFYYTLGVVFSEQYNLSFCPCSLANTSATIDFEFSGQVISVPINEMVLEGGLNTTLDCTFGIVAQPDNAGIQSYQLGDTFLRSAYVVYDLGNNAISLAQTNFLPSGSNILEIGTGGSLASISSSVSSATNPATATVTGTVVPGGATTTSVTSSAPTPSEKSSTHATSVMPTSTPAAGSVVKAHAGVCVLVAGAACIFAF